VASYFAFGPFVVLVVVVAVALGLFAWFVVVVVFAAAADVVVAVPIVVEVAGGRPGPSFAAETSGEDKYQSTKSRSLFIQKF